MAATRTGTLDELLLLYRGEVFDDGDTMTSGYPSIALAEAVCRESRPVSALGLFVTLYPGWKLEQIPSDEQDIVRAAFASWLLKGRP